MNSRLGLIAGIAVLLALVAGPAQASITYSASGSGGLSNLSASAEFAISGNNLIITLTNTASSPALEPADVLMGLFFSLDGATLTPVSAVLGGSSIVLYDSAPAGGVVGGEWAYASGINAPGDADQGVGAAGFDLFGSANFPGSNLFGQTGVQGMAYGIVPASGTTGGNAPVTGPNPFIQNSVVFTLSFTGDVTLDDISDVSFQYGTDLCEPNLPGTVVPEPASLSLLGIGIALMAMRRVLKKGGTN
ncbi:MAG: PEP-CTERM sorting domain-containing protein [Candidatus Hydrogenedentes bacterium]|nr:PEP-CTERM sorting domain-containing protein [Candidatus Hydrogenedentota bacterium]